MRPVVFLALLLMPRPEGMTAEGQATLAMAGWMAAWWLTVALPLASVLSGAVLAIYAVGAGHAILARTLTLTVALTLTLALRLTGSIAFTVGCPRLRANHYRRS